jgi:hypothetical protein
MIQRTMRFLRDGCFAQATAFRTKDLIAAIITTLTNP